MFPFNTTNHATDDDDSGTFRGCMKLISAPKVPSEGIETQYVHF